MEQRKKGWRLTFCEEFDRGQVNDLYWYTAYRSGQEEYFRRIGVKSRWTDHNACYAIADSVLKLRIDRALPYRPTPQTQCVSCFTTSDHRFGATTSEYQVLSKFAQKYGWFEIRCRCPRGEGLLSAFWLHQCDPTRQELTPEGQMRQTGRTACEIDIFEIQGRHIADLETKIDLNVHFTDHGHYLKPVPFDFSREFHVFAMEWSEGRINWFCDGTLLQTYEGPTPQEKMFILAALFQYSGWIGEIDPDMVYPRDFEIDYIRVYQREEI